MVPTLALLTALAGEPVKLKLIPSGAVAKAGGYRPIQAKFGAEPTAQVASKLPEAQYGKIVAGKKEIAFVISEPAGKPATLVVDANADGDLTNDAPAKWEPRKSPNGQTTYFGSAEVNIGKDVPVTVNFYRFDPTAAGREAYKSVLMYYFDYGYELSFKLDGKPYTSFVAGEPSEGTGVAIDRNGDGKISYFKESVTVGKPFNYTGTTYQFAVTPSGLSLEKSAEKLPKMALPPDFTIGKRTLPITQVALDGTKVDLMKDYKGKVVMLDFWATWCGPCIAELPNVKAAYAKWHDKGFEILGISFDNENMADKLKEFTVKNEMPWKHLYEGKGWNTEVGAQYDVSGIPFTLLIDGDTGKILGDSRNLRGPGIVDFVGEQLKKKGKA